MAYCEAKLARGTEHNGEAGRRGSGEQYEGAVAERKGDRERERATCKHTQKYTVGRKARHNDCLID
jgi:hypothetical protein